MSLARYLSKLGALLNSDGKVPAAGLATGVSQPAGMVNFFAMSSAPAGYLKANGAAISRTTYADLFTAIGTTFGVGDGSTTFNLPDLRGEFLRSWDDGRGVDSARGIGTAQSSQNLSHSHSLPGYLASTYTVYDGDLDGSTQATGYDKTTIGNGTNAEGGSEARPRNVALLACIKF